MMFDVIAFSSSLLSFPEVPTLYFAHLLTVHKSENPTTDTMKIVSVIPGSLIHGTQTLAETTSVAGKWVSDLGRG